MENSSHDMLMKRWVKKVGKTTFQELEQQEIAIPTPAKGQVRIKMKAASINYRDVFVSKDEVYPPAQLDTVPLSDGAGIIDAVGDGVDQWKVGDRVITMMFGDTWLAGPPTSEMNMGLGYNGNDGTLAEYIILNENQISLAPQNLSFTEAATLTCAGVTAWTGINGYTPYQNPFTSEDQVLLLGTGNVSLFGLLIAKALGAKVGITSSQEDKIEKLKALGADYTANYRQTQNWGEELLAASGGFDKVVNTAGSKAVNQSLISLKNGGEVAFIGLHEMEIEAPSYFTMMAKGLAIRGYAVGSKEAHHDFVQFVEQYDIHPIIYKTLSFDQAREAYEAATEKDVFGKVVIEF